MKKIYIPVLLLSLAFSACSKYLDVVPKEFVREDDIWSDPRNADRALATLYSAQTGLQQDIDAIGDEAKNHYEDAWQPIFNSGSWGITNNPMDGWSRYVDIRRANQFIANIEQVKLQGDDQISYYQPRLSRYKAEARVLRAEFYFDLYKRYGGVPVITTVLDLNEEGSTMMPRNAADEVVDFMAKECDTAATELPLQYPDNELGRMTKGAALALKSRILSYAASPLFNGNTWYAGIKNNDGKQLFNPVYDKEKWKKAADAAKAVLDLGVYSMYNPNPSNPVDNYARLFYTREWNETIIPYSTPDNYVYEAFHLPGGRDIGGGGFMAPLQGMVDSYEMNNGYPINEPGSGYTASGFWSGQLWDATRFVDVTGVSNMYKNRDPRFYASIFFTGGVWVYDRINRQLKFYYWGNSQARSDGWDNPGTHPETGYNIRKWNTPEINLRAGTGTAHRNYPIIRLPEIYLNYAEALNEYLEKPSAEVYNAINAVRDRVSMPHLPIIPSDYTKEGMRKRIQNENRVEFAFEGHRFWDERRWLIGTEMENGPVYGLNARPSVAELQATGLDPNSEEAGKAVFYKVVKVQDRVFLRKHYLMPIGKAELDKNPNLVQNYGW